MNVRRILGAALIATACVTTTVAAAGTSQAEGLINGKVNARLGLNVHSGSPTGAVIDTMPYNTTVQVWCWVSGPAVTGPFGTTTVWDAVNSYTTPSGQNVAFVGGTVFSSDAWINTGGDTSKMLPHC